MKPQRHRVKDTGNIQRSIWCCPQLAWISDLAVPTELHGSRNTTESHAIVLALVCVPCSVAGDVAQAGEHTLELFLMCDSYVGCDQEYAVDLMVGEAGSDEESDED